MQGQSSPVQVKDPYTGSILMHVGSSCKHTGVYNVHLLRIIRNRLMGVTRKQNNKSKNKLQGLVLGLRLLIRSAGYS